jgi:hypothetical protein
MTIESINKERDEKKILELNKGLKDALFKISSRKKYFLLNLLDNMDLNLAIRIDRGRSKNYNS